MKGTSQFLLICAFLFAAASSAAAKTVRIEISGMAFLPAAVKAAPGDTLEWTNKDFVAHTATAKDGRWDVVIPPHGTGTTVVKQAGSVDYYCRYHPTMTGSVKAE